MKISAVLVTFNRITLLKQVLRQFESLSRKPDTLIIVNNCSNDGTLEYLNEWIQFTPLNVKLVHLDFNVGGSGGFYEGLKEGLKTDSNWFWLSDDDAFPDVDAFKLAEKYLLETEQEKLGAICGSVINNDKIDVSHRRRLTGKIIKKEVKVDESLYAKKEFEIDLFSYVGAIISREALNVLGLTEKDYFIWYDDTEHSMRISKEYKIVCVPNIRVRHDTMDSVVGEISWKRYYGTRNKLIMYKKHHFPTFIFILIKLIISLIINFKKPRPFSINRIIIRSIFDALLNRKGVDKFYYPGRKI